MKSTKQRAQSLRMNTRNAELYWKELQLLRLAAACSKIARASVEVAKTRLFSQVVLPAKKRMLEKALS